MGATGPKSDPKILTVFSSFQIYFNHLGPVYTWRIYTHRRKAD